MPKYTPNNIVVFIDVLGFSTMLPEFEKEALANDSDIEGAYHESERLNSLLEIFQRSIALINKEDMRSYVFSDNICLTVNCSENPNLLVSIMRLLGSLFYDFSSKGYFLRGGIDVGWFLDYKDIAIGMPLVNAYLLETKTAIFPRVVLSNDYIQLLERYTTGKMLNEESVFLSQSYFKDDGQVRYLNPFYYIINFEDKESKIVFLESYSARIKEKLVDHQENEHILEKFRWMATEFNAFIDLYLTHDNYKNIDNEDLNYSGDEIGLLNSLKVN